MGNKRPAEMRKPIVKLITFGGGGADFREAAERLVLQSTDFLSINERKAYTDTDLPPDYHSLFSELNGYGYYSWKPYLVYAELLKLETNDILVYIDAGCELNKRGIRRFDDYLSYTSKNEILLFEMQHPNRFWTKNHPKLLGYPEHFFRNQLVATVIFLKNNERSRQLIKAWLDLCAYEHGVLLKAPEDNEPQLPGFMKHRCDQSCLSICAYLQNVTTIPDETWFQDWSYAQNYPILALRNKTGTSVLNKMLKVNIFKRIKKYIKMLKVYK
jgi:hypothetical protein